MPLTKVPNAQTFRRESNPIRNNPTVLNEYISDPFRRVLEITPAALDFGDVFLGEVHSLKVVLRNEDSLLMRFLIKQPKNPDFKVIFRPGPIAPGMVSKLIVELACRAIGEVKTEFEVYCKSEIYTVNITANIVGEESEGKHERIKGLVRKVRGNALPSLNKSIA